MTCPEPIYDAEVVGAGRKIRAPHAMAESTAAEHGVSSEESRRPCPMCGEMILATAARCRFCGEVFDPSSRRSRIYGSDDEELSATEITVAVLCSGIGCVTGLVYMIQGKPKGMKMFGLSALVMVIWNFVSFLLSAVARR